MKARYWLQRNLERACVEVLAEADLLAQLDPGTLSTDLTMLLDRVQRFVDSNTAFAAQATDRLEYVVDSHPGPGRPAVVVDRMVNRLLEYLPHPRAVRLAEACLASPRHFRRRGAWRYYLRHGLSDTARRTVVNQFNPKADRTLLDLIVSDPVTLGELGLAAVLETAPNRYVRARSLATALAHDLAIDECILVAYPAEWLWAVSLAEHKASLDAIVDMLGSHEADPDIVNRILLCVTALGDRGAIERTMAAAELILSSPAPQRPTPWSPR